MRPLLDGDSLSYHLPNAASWVQAHSLWTTATRYWWYPPASELFAAGLDTVGGPFPIAVVRLSARLRCSDFESPRGRASVTARRRFWPTRSAPQRLPSFPLAIQGGNDAERRLARGVLRSKASGRCERLAAASTAMRTLAVTALIKPQGWLWRRRIVRRKGAANLWLAALAALAIWIARDAVLLRRRPFAGGQAHGELFGSTIVAHGAPAFGLLARVVARGVALCFIGAPRGIARSTRRAPRTSPWMGGLRVSVHLLSLAVRIRNYRRAACDGRVVAFRRARNRHRCRAARSSYTRAAPAIATALLVVSTLYGVWYVLAIFWNDGGTHARPGIRHSCRCRRRDRASARVAWLNAVAFGLGVISPRISRPHPLDYYNDALRVGPIARRLSMDRDDTSAGGRRLGSAPRCRQRSLAFDIHRRSARWEACAQARRNALVLVAVAQNDLPFFANTLRLQEARACGHALFSDRIGIAAHP